MRRASSHSAAGTWPKALAADSVTLDFDGRYRRRIVLRTDKGTEVMLDLERTAAMAEGDGLALDGGGWLYVRAAAEPVIEITASTPVALARIAWHLGNRHLPMEAAENALYIRPDAVIEAMLRALGADVRKRERAFQPERGAYAQGHSHSHHDHQHNGHSHD